jgi:hypothetical protein
MNKAMPPPTRGQLVGWFEELGASSGLFRVEPGRPTGVGAVEPSVLDEQLDIELVEGNRRLRLLIEVKGQIHPRQVVSSLSPLASMARAAGGDTLAVLAATYVSPRVAQVCRDHGVGYVDGAGNAHLVGPGLCLHVEGRPNQRPDTRPAERLFAPKSSRIARVLLESPQRRWRVQDLANTAKVSIGLASRIKRKLVEEAYVEEASEGVRIADPHRLLGDWAAAYRLPRLRIPVYALDAPEKMARDVVQWGASRDVVCALAEFSAASRLAPMVRTNRAVVYVFADPASDTVEQLTRALSLRRVDSGPTAELWVTDDESVFHNVQEVDGTRVVSALQAYLDVRKNPARGQEAADELYRRFLEPRFAGKASES